MSTLPVPSGDQDKPFHLIHTDGTFIGSSDDFEIIKQCAQNQNQWSLDNGSAHRYLAIPKPNTPQEEL